jgi:N-acetylglucosaminyldiphosphoundecaprenol N-acetyl-beta-D-mannosaminyltransferase
MEKDDEDTIDYIKKCMNDKNVRSIDFLFVCYGHPGQEKWITRNSHLIPAHVSIGTGGTFDNIVGSIVLPPASFSSRNLGWLYRLIKQPWRIKRIFTAFPTFPLKVYTQSLK